MPSGWGSLKNPTISPLLQGSVVPGYPILLPSKWFSGEPGYQAITQICTMYSEVHGWFLVICFGTARNHGKI